MLTQIITPTEKKALIDIPVDWIGRPVKVTIDPIKEEPKPIFNTIEEVHAAFNAIRLDLRGWKFNRDEASER
jgi:hypothetical protein